MTIVPRDGMVAHATLQDRAAGDMTKVIHAMIRALGAAPIGFEAKIFADGGKVGVLRRGGRFG